MSKKIEYWKWKNTIIDFKNISDEKIDYDNYHTKKDWVFYYLGCPDEEIHEWYNGGFSSEYNTALRYAKQLGLVEDYIDYDEKIYDLQQELTKYKERCEKAIEELKKELEYSKRDCIPARQFTCEKILKILEDKEEE